MDKSKRKEMMDAYKKREQIGGIYCVTCSGNNRKWIISTVDLESRRNRFDFAVKMNGCPDPPMRNEWLKYGTASFSFTVLAELKKKDDQSSEEFAKEVKDFYELWLEQEKQGDGE